MTRNKLDLNAKVTTDEHDRHAWIADNDTCQHRPLDNLSAGT